jgi:hypothetical protein
METAEVVDHTSHDAASSEHPKSLEVRRERMQTSKQLVQSRAFRWRGIGLRSPSGRRSFSLESVSHFRQTFEGLRHQSSFEWVLAALTALWSRDVAEDLLDVGTAAGEGRAPALAAFDAPAHQAAPALAARGSLA